jgi:hypothetical protein
VQKIDEFDAEYRDQIRDAVFKAIIETARDPKTNVAALRNHEIYDALLQVQAMILATPKEASSPTRIRQAAEEFGPKLRRLVGKFKDTYDRDGAPLTIIHSDEMH